MGSEIHIDLFDDRVEIYSPGGMYRGQEIQERNILEVGSIRRNPIIADLFHRMKFMERRGSGLKKIIDETAKLPGYTESLKPEFRSTPSEFHVILKNVNYFGENSVQVQDNSQQSITDQILEYCVEPKTRKEICDYLDYKNLSYFSKHYLKPLIAEGKLKMTIPDNPKSQKQKYVTA